MAEVGEQNRLEKQKQGLELEREKMRRAIIRELKKKLSREKGVEKVWTSWMALSGAKGF